MSKEENTNDDGAASGGIVNGLMDYAVKTINDADAAAAAETADKVRQKNAELSESELADILIKRKCYRTGAVGAITSGISIVPGIGSVVALTFGAAADISMTFKQQAELVLEIAALYDQTLSPQDKRTAILLVTGIGAGSQQLAVKGGEKIAQKATEQLATQAAAKAIPFSGVGVSAGANILTTYIIGQRAKKYFSLDPDELEDWSDSIAAITGADELKIGEWLSETTTSSYQMVSSSAQGVMDGIVGGVVVAGQKSGELVLVTANQTSQGVTALVGSLGGAASYASQFVLDSGKVVGQAASATGKSVIDAGKWTGDAVVDGGQSLIDMGGSVAGSVADGVTDVASSVTDTVGNTVGSTVGSTVGDTVRSATDAAKSALGGITKRLWGNDDDEIEDDDKVV